MIKFTLPLLVLATIAGCASTGSTSNDLMPRQVEINGHLYESTYPFDSASLVHSDECQYYAEGSLYASPLTLNQLP